MAEKILFAAEADQIQATLFRHSRQRQVLGGSRLLDLFGVEVKALAEDHGGEALIYRGGNFRIVFPKTREDEIPAFQRELSLLYHLTMQGDITIAGHLPYSDEDSNGFAEANRRLQHELRRRKVSDRGVADEAHMPLIAFCQNSGSGLAAYYTSLLPGEEDAKYTSTAAWNTGEAGGLGRYNQEQQQVNGSSPLSSSSAVETSDPDARDSFLQDIANEIEKEELRTYRWARTPEEIGKLDPRNNNVAYMLADANGMGRLFSAVESEDELSLLSETLDSVVRKALAHPIARLHECLQERMGGSQSSPATWLPLLPLILAGDDVFTLLPACYALDFARRFCLKFGQLMKDELGNASRFPVLFGKLVNKDIPGPTISAAVVFCKTKYPYHLAHTRGESLLKDAKRFSKVHTHEGQPYPSISFEIIVGSELVKSEPGSNDAFVNSMNPYWLEVPKGSHESKSVALDDLLAARRDLRNIRGKRLAQLREFFTEPKLPKTDEDWEKWADHLKEWMRRLRVVYPTSTWVGALKSCITDLGNGRSGNAEPSEDDVTLLWRNVRRQGSPPVRRHGMLDLIQVWQYAQDLGHTLNEYEEGADDEA